MEIIEFDLSNVPTYKGIVLCLGFFDGIHLGHQEIIKRALKTNKKVGILSFSTPPAYVIGRKDTKRSLTSIDDKADILEELGVSYLFIMPFDSTIMNLSKLDFINYVLKIMEPSEIFCGEDYRFGKEASGNPQFLSAYFKVHVIPLQKVNGMKFSSKDIRHLLFDGKINEATSLLGHYYRIAGLVVSGKHKGSELGFPTANMELDFPYIIPPNGVYSGYAHVHEQKYKCLISIGTHPSLEQLDAPIIEVYILDFEENIYGAFIYIEFVSKIRDMFKFDNIEDLKAQIRKDRLEALKILN